MKRQRKRVQVPQIGAKLRYLRRTKRMQLKEVAEQVGCSESMMSKIENNNALPSLTLLHRIASILGANINYLFAENSNPDQFVAKSGSRAIIEMGSAKKDQPHVKLDVLVPPSDTSLLQANIHIVPPRAGSDGGIEHEGQEVGYVLEGEFELIIAGQCFHLSKGDSFTFHSNITHEYRNVGPDEARILWANTPATF